MKGKVALVTGASSGIGRSTALAFADRGARTGIIDTPMHQRLRGIVGDELYESVLQGRVHQKRKGLPEEIAKVIVFLCSDEASYITGTTVTPDGGFTMTL